MPKKSNKIQKTNPSKQPDFQKDAAATPTSKGRPQLRAVLSQRFEGPLPPPEIFAGYEKTLPGAADRILAMAETQAKHRQSLEQEELESENDAISRGQWFAFIITVLVIISGVYLISVGMSPWGLALILTDLALLAGVFIFDRFKDDPKYVDDKE